MSASRRFRRTLGNHVPALLRLARESDLPAGSVSEVIVEHDSWCGAIKGRRCNCVPSVRLVTTPPPDVARN